MSSSLNMYGSPESEAHYWREEARRLDRRLQREKSSHKARVNEESLLLAEQAVRQSKRLRRWAALLPGALVLSYLTLLFNHPLGLLLTVPAGVLGVFTAFNYFDGGTVPEIRDTLERKRAAYATQMLEENP